jgi:hypothetical protein
MMSWIKALRGIFGVGEALSDICSPYLDARDPHDQIGVLRGNF